MSDYEPPCTISPKIVELVAEVCEAVGERGASNASIRELRLRRLDRIRTIQGSLAIEGNELSTNQITALMEGKPVVAAARDIAEAKNAIQVYDQLEKWDPHSVDSLLNAHRLLMDGLAEDAGRFRSAGVGVVSGIDIVHLAPAAAQVDRLMADLFEWVRQTDQHPLIASSIFHYEFEFIHPFSDGNGRMGRLWQSLLLTRWNSIFSTLPVESLVFAKQKDYYLAIQQSTDIGDSRPFVEFMLASIRETLLETPQATPQATPQVEAILKVLGDDELSRSDLQTRLRLKDAKSFRKRYLKPALRGGWIEQTVPEKPNSPKQRYRKIT
ncbi:MAG: Fic family protein [Verrucomicrobiota bacterium]